MKRLFFTIFSFLLVSQTHAQLFLNNNGNLGVKVSSGNVDSYWTVNSPGDPNVCTFIFSDADEIDKGLRLTKRGLANTLDDYNIGIDISVKSELSSTKKAFGLNAGAYKTSSTTSGRNYGIYGAAGNATSGWNYGVFGTLFGTSGDGAGVFGSSVDLDGGVPTSGRFAGFFHGNVKSTNAFLGTAFNTTSDYRLKENIESVESNCIDNVMRLNVVKYKLKQFTIDVGDTTSIPINYYTDDPNLLNKTHYGLIAQELQDLYPDLVYEGEDGYLSINYIEMIPLLIKTIQDLKHEVAGLHTTNKATLRNEGTTTVSNNMSSAILYQNNPNPFTENTIVKCLIPQEVSSAVLYIYDMNGRQIDSRFITERGAISLTIEGGSLDAGIYLYSLITDGEVVDTKRMILTK